MGSPVRLAQIRTLRNNWKSGHTLAVLPACKILVTFTSQSGTMLGHGTVAPPVIELCPPQLCLFFLFSGDTQAIIYNHRGPSQQEPHPKTPQSPNPGIGRHPQNHRQLGGGTSGSPNACALTHREGSSTPAGQALPAGLGVGPWTSCSVSGGAGAGSGGCLPGTWACYSGS